MAASRSVLVLVGPKGSGKTYIGALINKELGARFLRVEPIFLENMRSSHLTGTALDEEGYSKVLGEIDFVLSRESRVVIESTGASEAFPAFLHALRSRYEVTLVSIRAPLERCLERIRSRDQTMHIPVSDDRVAEINARAAMVRLPWDLEIDNGGPASAERPTPYGSPLPANSCRRPRPGLPDRSCELPALRGASCAVCEPLRSRLAGS